MTVTLVVADPLAVVRVGLLRLVEESTIEIVGEAADSDGALRETVRHGPDVLLLDTRIPERGGMWVLEKVRERVRGTAVIMFADEENELEIARAVAFGAADYVLKAYRRHKLIDAIGRAASGGVPDECSPLARVASLMGSRDNPKGVQWGLTNRETQVGVHIALGLQDREIALALGISVNTVKEHVRSILQKLNVPNRTAAAVSVVKQGLLT